MTLHVKSVDKAALESELEKKVRQAPGMFKNAPMLIDLHSIKNRKGDSLDVAYLIELLQKHGINPLGIRGGNKEQLSLANEAGLPVLAENKAEKPSATTQAKDAPPSSAPVFGSGVKVVTQPVRSGQQVVAKQGNLVVLSMVSPGAEILAEGSIHVYGALRGRALAGVTGDTSARIFCQNFDAELVSVAGQYQINEDYEEHLFGKAVQVFLQDDELKLETFGHY